MRKIAVFVSGGGSDLQSVIDGCADGRIDGRVVCVVSNKEGVYALERAKKHGIAHAVFPLRNYADAPSRDAAIVAYLADKDIDLLVFAGYLSIATATLVNAYRGRIVNIHPSLIPKYCGMGMYGLRVHQAVLAGGETESGATVHYVDEGADTGEIIEQVRVPVLPDDTPETLQARVLEQEHILLPRVVARICAAKA